MKDLFILELDYQLFLNNQYSNLCDLPGFMLLQSTDRVLGRYDLIAAYPYDQMLIHRDDSDISAQLKRLKALLPINPSKSSLPFQGGAMGYISYDLGERLFHIESTSQPSLDSMPLLDLKFYHWSIIVDHLLKKVTVCASNDSSETIQQIDEVRYLWQQSQVIDKQFKLEGNFSPLTSKNSYKKSFQSIYRALKGGRSYQVNLTQPFHAPFTGDSWGLYQKLSQTNPVPFSAFMRADQADVVCFSPERFLMYDLGTILASPIKGTIARSNDRIEDERLKKKLELCAKNRAENIMIVDLLRNDLGKIAKAGTVNVRQLCEVQSYNSVHHLVSDIEAQCFDDFHPLDVFLSCFPGGSITGAPKLEAMKIISEEESYSRGIYCGSIGYFSNHGRFDMNIAIRTITAKDNILHLAAGGAIVIDSNDEEEYQECYTKIAAII